MSNQIVISSGAKVRSLEGVLTGTAGIVNSVPLGGANGVATLDSLGKVPLSQLPASVVTYLGTWNAATNTPTLTNGVGDVGDLYICNVAGTVNFGAGPITFAVGDWVIYSGTEWQKSSGASGTVTSVAVTESGDALTITGSPITTSGTINIGFAGTGSQYIKGDGTLATFPTTIDQAKRLITEVYNSTGATLSKGTVVYINGGQGNLPTVTKAQANADNTSAQTYGVVQSDITNNNNGFVVVIGSLTDIDTQAYSVGTQLYLSGTTAGDWTSTKPSAPIHLVYVGIVVRSHPTQGVVEIRIQNGYELEELHDVAISAPVNNQGIFYNSSNNLWENKSIATALGYTPANDALVVHLAGTETITGDKTFSNITRFTDFVLMDFGVALAKTSGTPLLGGSSGYANLQLVNVGSVNSLYLIDGNTLKYSSLSFNNAADYSYTFPALNGTLALLEGTQTFSGNKTFSALTAFTFLNGTRMDYGLYLSKGSVPSAFSGSTVNLYSDSGNNNLVVRDNSNTSLLQFQAASSYTYTFPAASGTLALTSNLSSYVPYTGATTNVDLGSNFLKARTFYSEGSGGGGSYAIKNGTTPSFEDGYTILSSNDYRLNIVSTVSAATKAVYFGFSGVTATRTYTLPDASGTLALTSNLSSYVPYTGATGAVDLGNYDLTVYGIKVGRGAGSISTNIVLGASALSSNTTGSINTAIGTGSLQSNTTGSANTAIGNVTLNSNLTGQNNTAIGNTALSMTTSSYNTGIGAGSLANNTSGSYNTGLGYGSGSSITTGSYNVIIGSYTGTSGMSNNIVLADGQGNIRYQWNGTTNNFTGSGTFSGDLRLDNGSADGGQLVLASSGFSDWNLDNFSGRFRAYYGATEYFTILANGNVGIGTNSPAAALHITGAIGESPAANGILMGIQSNYAVLHLNGTATTGALIDFSTSGTDYKGRIEYDNITNYMRFGTNGAERMRITSSGNVGIGTSSPTDFQPFGYGPNIEAFGGRGGGFVSASTSSTYKMVMSVDSSGGYGTLKVLTNHPLMFATNDTERMRITSGGNVLIGGTDVANLGTTNRIGAFRVDSSGEVYLQLASTGSSVINHAFFYNSTGLGGYIRTSSGTIAFVNGSDYRMKTNISLLENGLDSILKLKPSKYEYISNEGELYEGFIAHELQAVIPSAVVGEKDAVNEDGTPNYQGVDTVKIIPYLVKAIQELSAKVTALENK